jgi:WD40 repeat protein
MQSGSSFYGSKFTCTLQRSCWKASVNAFTPTLPFLRTKGTENHRLRGKLTLAVVFCNDSRAKSEDSGDQANVFLARNLQSIKNDESLAYLANALRLNPRNSEAAALTEALLTQGSWPVLSGALEHDLGVNSAQFSGDGQRVVTASEDKTARVWDAATGKALSEPMKHVSHCT